MTYKIDHTKCPKSQVGYVTRALQASDPRAMGVFAKMGYLTREMTSELTREMVAEQPVPPAVPIAAQPAPPPVPPASLPEDAMAELRAEYKRVIGKNPFMGWDADTLRQKMVEATEDTD